MQDVVNISHEFISESAKPDDFESVRSRYGPVIREVSFVDDLSASEFFERFLLPNKACLVGEKFTRTWLSREKWVKGGKPNWDYLKEQYGDVKVPVADCNREQYGSHVKIEMSLGDYLDYWLEDIHSRSSDGDTRNGPRRILYLKDWHFCRQFKDSPVYSVAEAFQSDFLNEYWDTTEGDDDYRFVYMGPKGTWTPFHADVFKSYSWSTNVCGRKRWLLFPPGDEKAFLSRFGSFPLDVTSDELADRVQYPMASSAKAPIVVIQEAGQTIFVPSGWHHQVENLEDTISINHNWGNACNLTVLWAGLLSDLKQVEEAISDCTDMDGYHQHCQLLLRTHSGLNFCEFLKLLLAIINPRLAKLSSLLSIATHQDSLVEDQSGAAALSTEYCQLSCCKDISFTFQHPHMNVFDLSCLRLVLSDVLAQDLEDCLCVEERDVLHRASLVHKALSKLLSRFFDHHHAE